MGSTVAVSLQGDFKDPSLLWGSITEGPSAKQRAACKARHSHNTARHVTFQVQWCKQANSTSHQQVLKELQGNYNRARLIEHSASFATYTPVLDALRMLWTPGCPIELPFFIADWEAATEQGL